MSAGNEEDARKTLATTVLDDTAEDVAHSSISELQWKNLKFSEYSCSIPFKSERQLLVECPCQLITLNTTREDIRDTSASISEDTKKEGKKISVLGMAKSTIHKRRSLPTPKAKSSTKEDESRTVLEDLIIHLYGDIILILSHEPSSSENSKTVVHAFDVKNKLEIKDATFENLVSLPLKEKTINYILELSEDEKSVLISFELERNSNQQYCLPTLVERLLKLFQTNDDDDDYLSLENSAAREIFYRSDQYNSLSKSSFSNKTNSDDLYKQCSSVVAASENDNRFLSNYLNIVDSFGSSSLHYALFNGNCQMAKLLMFFGADKQATDNHMRTPLHYAAIGLEPSSLRTLINTFPLDDISPHTNAVDLDNNNALFLAMESFFSGNEEEEDEEFLEKSINILLSSSLDLNHVNLNDDTATLFAIRKRSATVLKMLLDHGASMDSGKRAVDVVSSMEPIDLDCLHVILLYGANPNQRGSNRDTLLHRLLTKFLEMRKNCDESRGDLKNVVSACMLLTGFGARTDLENKSGVNVASLIADSGLNFSASIQKYATKEEPTDAVRTLMGLSPFSLPATHPRNLLPEKQKPRCEVCRNVIPFILLKGRPIRGCSACGKVLCRDCARKRFTLSSQQENSTKLEMKKYPVCVCCFNNLSRSVSELAKEIKELPDNHSNTQIKEKMERATLFQTTDAGSPKDAADNENDKVDRLSLAKNEIAKARENLANRGDKLSSLASKAQRMEQGAESFASMAEKIRKREEKRKSFFGLF